MMTVKLKLQAAADLADLDLQKCGIRCGAAAAYATVAYRGPASDPMTHAQHACVISLAPFAILVHYPRRMFASRIRSVDSQDAVSIRRDSINF